MVHSFQEMFRELGSVMSYCLNQADLNASLFLWSISVEAPQYSLSSFVYLRLMTWVPAQTVTVKHYSFPYIPLGVNSYQDLKPGPCDL